VRLWRSRVRVMAAGSATPVGSNTTRTGAPDGSTVVPGVQVSGPNGPSFSVDQSAQSNTEKP
jgi:hypothetical protein